jgi:hypothetical protein
VKVPTAVVLQLHLLSRDHDRGAGFVAGLDQLSTELARVVPSLLAVSVMLVRLGQAVVVPALASPAGTAAVGASLAVPLSPGPPGDVLVLQAAEPGAFLLLADDLAGLLDADRPLELDRHLGWSPATYAASFALVLAELEVLNQAIGVLVDRGALDQETALVDLRGRAAATGTTPAAVSRRLLAGLGPPAADDG